MRLNDYPQAPIRSTLNDGNRVYQGDGVAHCANPPRHARQRVSRLLWLELFNKEYWTHSADENLKTAMERSGHHAFGDDLQQPVMQVPLIRPGDASALAALLRLEYVSVYLGYSAPCRRAASPISVLPPPLAPRTTACPKSLVWYSGGQDPAWTGLKARPYVTTRVANLRGNPQHLAGIVPSSSSGRRARRRRPRRTEHQRGRDPDGGGARQRLALAPRARTSVRQGGEGRHLSRASRRHRRVPSSAPSASAMSETRRVAHVGDVRRRSSLPLERGCGCRDR